MADLKISQLTGATTPLAGTEVLPIVQSSSTVKVSVDNLTKGRTVNATTFDTDVAAAGVTLSGTTLAADGTDAAININITPKGAGVAQTTASDAIVKFRVNTANAGVSASNYSQFELADTGSIRTFWRSVRDGSGKTVFAYNDHLSVWANGATEVWRFTLDGNLAQYTALKGINFTANTPAAGMTSQLLNWYEEGTWTPTDASGAGLTFTVTYAKYVRAGKQVTVNMFITFPSTASGAQVTIGGLPFSVGSGNYPPATFASNSGTALSGFGNATAKTVSVGTAADYSSAVANSTMSGRNLVMSLSYLVD
jgi:hypothetical protein